ncbi:MAG: hypothetical protein V1809_00850 [Planctomycetota bacterium]
MDKHSVWMVLTVVVCLGFVGCGDSGGGAAATSSTEVPVGVKTLVALFSSDNFRTLFYMDMGFRAPPRDMHQSQNSVAVPLEPGAWVTTYGPGDTQLMVGNVTAEYGGGTTTTYWYDYYGALSVNMMAITDVHHSYSDLRFSFTCDGTVYDVTKNGEMEFSGFSASSPYSISAQNLLITGSTSTGEVYRWSIPSSSVDVTDVMTYRYPVSGQTESGTITWNGASYGYSIYYDGTTLATVTMSGASIGSFVVNLAEGAFQ